MDNIMSMVSEQMKKKGLSKKDMYNYLSVSQNTFDNYLNNKYPITLAQYFKICELLKLNPSFFFESNQTFNSMINEGVQQYATGGKNTQNATKQSHDNTEILKVEIEGLKKENALLREMLEMYKSR